MGFLQDIWFLLVSLFLMAYGILDGFDLGIGILSLFTRSLKTRERCLSSIGPVWEGNEIWLLTAAGALFVAFPLCYATLFDGLFLTLILMLSSLTIRSLTMEIRRRKACSSWMSMCERIFCVSSFLSAFLIGVAFGNILHGIRINEHGINRGSFVDIINPYAIGIGLLTLGLFSMHGNLYFLLKTDGRTKQIGIRWAKTLWGGTMALFLIMTAATLLVSPFLFESIGANIIAWIMLATVVASGIWIPLALQKKRYTHAFVGSSVMIAGMIGLGASGLFPRLVPSIPSLEYSRTIQNSSSSSIVLMLMLVVTALGLPMLVSYTVFIRRVANAGVMLPSND